MAALSELPLYAAALVCLGLAAILVLLVYALFKGIIDILNVIPKVNIGTAWLDGVKQTVWHALGVAYHGIDSALGWQIHNLANLTKWLWREFNAHSALFVALAGPLSSLLQAFLAVRALVHTIEHDLRHGNKRFEEELRRLGRGIDRINTKIRGLDHRIDDVVMPRVQEAEHEIAHLGDVVIPNVRDLVYGAEADISALRKWITANIPLVGTTAFVGAIAFALSQLGLGGLRCPSFGRLLSKWGCGLGGLLDALLGLAISALALENVCTLLPIAETAFGDVVGPVTHLLTEVPLGGCETPPKGWPTLSVATGPLPPPQTLGTLAA